MYDEKKINALRTMIAVETANTLSLEMNDIFELRGREKKNYNTKANIMLLLLKKKLTKYSTDEDFLKKILNNLNFIIDYGEFTFENNLFKGKFISLDKKRILNFELLVKKDRITYKINRENGIQVKTGTLKKNQNGEYGIIYKSYDEITYSNGEQTKIYEICKKTDVELYDKNGIQQSNLSKEKKENYKINTKTNEKELLIPNVFENYSESNYSFRADEYIIKKLVKKYILPEESIIHNQDFMVIGKNVNINSKKLPDVGFFGGFPKELYEEYKNGDCDVKKLVHSSIKDFCRHYDY